MADDAASGETAATARLAVFAPACSPSCCRPSSRAAAVPARSADGSAETGPAGGPGTDDVVAHPGPAMEAAIAASCPACGAVPPSWPAAGNGDAAADDTGANASARIMADPAWTAGRASAVPAFRVSSSPDADVRAGRPLATEPAGVPVSGDLPACAGSAAAFPCEAGEAGGTCPAPARTWAKAAPPLSAAAGAAASVVEAPAFPAPAWARGHVSICCKPVLRHHGPCRRKMPGRPVGPIASAGPAGLASQGWRTTALSAHGRYSCPAEPARQGYRGVGISCRAGTAAPCRRLSPPQNRNPADSLAFQPLCRGSAARRSRLPG